MANIYVKADCFSRIEKKLLIRYGKALKKVVRKNWDRVETEQFSHTKTGQKMRVFLSKMPVFSIGQEPVNPCVVSSSLTGAAKRRPTLCWSFLLSLSILARTALVRKTERFLCGFMPQALTGAAKKIVKFV